MLQVVENVIDLISRTCLVENEVFLRRWARVDSGDGTEPETYGVAYSGGIWKVCSLLRCMVYKLMK